jgi:hypothetical protein
MGRQPTPYTLEQKKKSKKNGLEKSAHAASSGKSGILSRSAP